MRTKHRLLATALISTLAVTPVLAGDAASSKSILGALLQVGLGLLLPQASGGVNAAPQAFNAQTNIAPSNFKEALTQTGVQIASTLMQRYFAPPSQFTQAAPTLPAYNPAGVANYQGMRLAISMVDANGQVMSDRAVSAGFSTGERFKVRILPTFTGLVEIDNIDGYGRRTRIYPEGGQVIEVQAGREAQLPLAANQAFEFADSKGEEQLIVSVRDPRAQGAALSNAPVNVQEDGIGSYYVQQTGNGQFASIVQTIRMSHR